MKLKQFIASTKQKYLEQRNHGMEMRNSYGGLITDKGTIYLPENWEPFSASMLSTPLNELKRINPVIYYFKTQCNTNEEFWKQILSGQFGVFVVGVKSIQSLDLVVDRDGVQSERQYTVSHRTNGKINLKTFQLNSHFSSELVYGDITGADYTGVTEDKGNKFQNLRPEKFEQLPKIKVLNKPYEFFQLYEEVFKRSSGWTWIAIKRHLNRYGINLWKECFNGEKSPTKIEQIVTFLNFAMKDNIWDYKYKTTLNSVKRGK